MGITKSEDRRVAKLLRDSLPANCTHPVTAEEHRKVYAAFEELAYGAYRVAGLSRRAARKLAQFTHGGVAARALLANAFSPPSD